MPPLTSVPDLHALLIGPFAEFGFMRRALVGGIATAVGAAPVGVFLLLRRLSLTGEAIAHAILPGVAVAFFIAGLSVTAMAFGGLLAGLLVASLSGILARKTALKEDAALGAIHLVSLAAGVMIISVKGTSIDLLHILFGNMLAIGTASIVLTAAVTTLSLAALAVMYRGLVLECVDPAFLHTVSRAGPYIHQLFLMLVVANLVAGLQSLGIMMVIGIMILPAASARLWANDVSRIVALAVVIAVLGCYAGLLASYHADVPSGATVVLTLGFFHLLSVLFGQHGLAAPWRRVPRHLTG